MNVIYTCISCDHIYVAASSYDPAYIVHRHIGREELIALTLAGYETHKVNCIECSRRRDRDDPQIRGMRAAYPVFSGQTLPVEMGSGDHD